MAKYEANRAKKAERMSIAEAQNASMKKTHFIIYNGFKAEAIVGRADVGSIYDMIDRFSVSIGNGRLHTSKKDFTMMCSASKFNYVDLHPSHTIFAELFDDPTLFQMEVARLQEA